MLSENYVLSILQQLLEGFKILQKYQILHRDIKPDNIMFKNNKVKLIDFGISKMLNRK